jgi:hypothetical protein
MRASCTVLCGMPCTQATAHHMFADLAPDSYAMEWLRGKCTVAEALVQAYMADLPAVWDDIVAPLRMLDVHTIGDATRSQFAQSLAESDVTIVVAHHVQRPDMTSIGIELVDGVLAVSDLPNIAPTHAAAIVDLLGVCRSESFIPLIKHRCGATRVIARKSRVDPIAQLRLILRTIQLWRGSTNMDYVDAVIQTRMAMLAALGVHEA